MGSQSDHDKGNLKFLFWLIIGPILFLTFLRMFIVLLAFINTGILLLFLGYESIDLITKISFVLAFFSAHFFAIALLIWLYRQFKKYIVED